MAENGRQFETLLCEELSGDVLIVRFNRPHSANALNTQMARDILALFAPLRLDAGALRCVVLTGAGDHFCAGGDLKQRDGMSDQAWRAQHAVFEQAFYAIMECPLPVIAAVNGSAFGGGCEFALACDFIYSAPDVRFAFPETRLGIIPGGGGTQTLARVVGPARAKEIILTAKPFEAADAERWGMVNRIVAKETLLEEAVATARHIAANGPVAIRQAKLAIDNGGELDRRSGLVLEIAAYNQTVSTADRREGIRAALEKRMPKFTGK